MVLSWASGTMSGYIDKEGRLLARLPAMFHWRGRYFSGLVSGNKALYDDPEDSFCAYLGIESSLDKGLIFKTPADSLAEMKARKP